MAARPDPKHPVTPRVDARGVSLAPGASTMSDDDLEFGAETRKRVLAGNLGSAPEPGDSLLAAYRRWAARQAAEAATPLAKAKATTAADLERHALERSRRRVAKRLKKGHAPVDALVAGYRRYQKLGGKLRLEAWHRQVTSS